MLDWLHPAAQAVVLAAAVVTALGVLWRKVVRPIGAAAKQARSDLSAVRRIAEQELLHNGGSSAKDQLARIEHRVGGLERGMSDLQGAVRDKQDEHDRIWSAMQAIARMR